MKRALGLAALAFLTMAGCGGETLSGDAGIRDGSVFDRSTHEGSSDPDVVRKDSATETGSEDAGACVPACGGECIDGRCLVTLSTGGGGGPLVLSDSTVIWLDLAGRAVLSVPTSGGETTTLAANQIGFFGLGAGNGVVYWTMRTSETTGLVLSVPLTGGAITTFASGQNSPDGVTADVARVYWTNGGAWPGEGGLYAAPLSGIPEGGAPTTLASGESVANSLAVDATGIYWGTLQAIMAVGLDGGIPTALVDGGAGVLNPMCVAIDEANVYWTDDKTGSVTTVPKHGGEVITLASDLNLPSGIVVDSTNVYWIGGGGVQTVPIDGGSPVTLATLAGGVGIAVDDTSLYWTTSSGVLKLTPK